MNEIEFEGKTAEEEEMLVDLFDRGTWCMRWIKSKERTDLEILTMRVKDMSTDQKQRRDQLFDELEQDFEAWDLHIPKKRKFRIPSKAMLKGKTKDLLRDLEEEGVDYEPTPFGRPKRPKSVLDF